MSLNPRFSAIIPTYNRAERLMRALASVYSQLYLPKKVIVIDDGSSDETGRRVHAEFPQVHYLFQKNRGVSAARNVGIRQARGEWLAFLDSDDEWLPKKLERQREILRRNPQFRIVHTDEVWIRYNKRVNPKKKHQKYGGYIFQKCLPRCVISPSSVTIHNSVFDRVGLFDESLPVCEDYDLWLRICSSYPVCFIDEPLIIKHGGHDDQLSHKYVGMDRLRIQALEKIIRCGRLRWKDSRAVFKTILEKITIYLNGARKRNKVDEVKTYQEKKAYYESRFLTGKDVLITEHIRDHLTKKL